MMAAQSLRKKIENMKFRMDLEPAAESSSYLEVQDEPGSREKERIFVAGIKGVHSTAMIARKMRDSRGIFLLSIKEVMRNEELRPCIERVKKDCRDNNYYMALIDNEWIMMLPRNSGMEFVSE